jgi:hypothetical protein
MTRDDRNAGGVIAIGRTRGRSGSSACIRLESSFSEFNVPNVAGVLAVAAQFY